MATYDIATFETTISATVSDNDNPYTTTTLPTSDDGAQCRASGEATMTMMLRQGMEEENKPHTEDKGREDQKESLPLLRIPKLKREKSYSETLERKKKRVKFSTNDDDNDVIVDTRVFEPQMVDTQDGVAEPGKDDNALSSTIKKFLRKRSKKRKTSIETQTEGKNGEEQVQETKYSCKISRSDEQKRERESRVPINGEIEVPVLPSPERRIRHENGVTNDDDRDHASNVSSPDSDTPESPYARASEESSNLTQPSSRLVTGYTDDDNSDVSVEAGVPTVPCPAKPEGEHDATQCDEDERCLWILEEQYDLAVRDTENGYDYRNLRNPVSCLIRLPDERYQYDKDIPHQAAPLTEEQELEISEGSRNDDPSEKLSSSCEESTPVVSDDSSSTSSQVTVKREGTFTLDGPPPAKITKPSCDADAEDAAPSGRIPPRDSIMEPFQFFVDLNAPNLTASEDSPAVSLRNNVNKKPILTSSKNSPKLKRSTKIVEYNKKVENQNSTVKSLKNNAKRTLVNAWKTATKTQDTPNKPLLTSPRETPTSKPSPSKLQQEKKTKVNTLRRQTDPKTPKSVAREKQKTPTPKKEPREPLKRGRDPIRDIPRQDRLRSPPERNSVWAGMSLPTFRREGTFTKKYDSERDRLQAECNRLNVEKDRYVCLLLSTRV